jgi:plastocyanin
MRRSFLLVILLGLCTVSTASAQPAATINMTDDTFAQTSVTIAAGQSVVWMNGSSKVHTVTADDGSFDSGDIATGGPPYSQEFDAPGTYAYFCQYHGDVGGVGMSGVIVVQ